MSVAVLRIQHNTIRRLGSDIFPLRLNNDLMSPEFCRRWKKKKTVIYQTNLLALPHSLIAILSTPVQLYYRKKISIHFQHTLFPQNLWPCFVFSVSIKKLDYLVGEIYVTTSNTFFFPPPISIFLTLLHGHFSLTGGKNTFNFEDMFLSLSLWIMILEVAS